MESYLVGYWSIKENEDGTNGLEKQNMAVHCGGTCKEEEVSVISTGFDPRRTEKV